MYFKQNFSRKSVLTDFASGDDYQFKLTKIIGFKIGTNIFLGLSNFV